LLHPAWNAGAACDKKILMNGMQHSSVTASLLQRFARDEKGAGALEFALVAFPVFLLIMAVMEFGLMFFTQMQLENIMSNAIRTTSITSGTATTRARAIQNMVEQQARELIHGDSVRTSLEVVNGGASSYVEPELCYTNPPRVGRGCPPGVPFEDYNGNGVFDNGNTSNDPGGKNDVVQINAYLVWRFFTPFLGTFFSGDSTAKGYTGGSGHMIHSSAVIKNEPF
jgi:Flp pilus assembly pilin Flp